jgi:autotransporter-associated beta strand protein
VTTGSAGIAGTNGGVGSAGGAVIFNLTGTNQSLTITDLSTDGGVAAVGSGALGGEAGALHLNLGSSTAIVLDNSTISSAGGAGDGAGSQGAGADLIFTHDVTLQGVSASISTGSTQGDVIFYGTLDGAVALITTTGTGSTIFTDAVGGVLALTSLDVANATQFIGSMITTGSAITTSGAQTYGGSITLGVNAVLTATGLSAGDVALGKHNLNIVEAGVGATAGSVSGVISGTGSLTKSGTGIVDLAVANTYSGVTTISAGTLAVSGSLSNLTQVGIASGATYRVDASDTVGSIEGAGNITTGAASGTVVLTVDMDTSLAKTYSGEMSDGVNANLEFLKTGAGSLTLSGANSLAQVGFAG